MKVLGISCYFHDAAATLVIDGKVVAAVEEERFTRRKHDNRFPELSIKYCLDEAGINATDLDYICFYEKPLPESSLYSNYGNDAEQMFKRGYTVREIISKTTELLDLKHSSRNRVKLSDELLLNDKDFAVVRAKWEKSEKQNWRLLSLEALAASLEINGSSISSDAKSIENHYRILNKKIIVLMSDFSSGKNGEGPFVYEDTDSGSIVTTLMESVAVLDRSGNKIDSILAQIENFKSDLENLSLDESPDMDLLNKNLEVRFEIVKSTILNYCTESLMLLKAVMKMVGNVLSIPEYREESIPTQETGKALASISEDISNLLNMTLKWSQYINIKNINLNELPASSEKQVRLNINMKCKATKKSMITVNVNSIVPHISYYFDQQSVYMDEEFHLYSFKLPIYFLGAFRIWITEASDISFNDIEIYLDRRKSIKFQKEKLSVDESGIINFPLMLMPL